MSLHDCSYGGLIYTMVEEQGFIPEKYAHTVKQQGTIVEEQGYLPEKQAHIVKQQGTMVEEQG